MSKLPDTTWSVIQDHLEKIDGERPGDELRAAIEDGAEVSLFDGGAFIVQGNEFDLFVDPDRRGKWQIRSRINELVERLMKEHGSAVVEVDEGNDASLRLAHFFGFKETSREDGFIRLEKHNG